MSEPVSAPGGTPHWVPILLPELGAGTDPIRISTWLVSVGETVEEGDRVVELLLPGLTFDVAAPVRGRLKRIAKMMDEPVTPGETLGWIEPQA